MRQPAYDSDFWDDDFDDEVEDDFSTSGSNSLVSVPASVRQQLSRVDRPVPQDRQQTIQSAMQVAIAELARSSPNLAAPLIGAAFGVRRVEETHIEKFESYERIERRVLGFNCGEEFVPMTTTRTTVKRWEVG